MEETEMFRLIGAPAAAIAVFFAGAAQAQIYQTFGNTTYGSDGSIAQTLGNTTYFSLPTLPADAPPNSIISNPTMCTTYGNTTYCN
jgi:hypothetical protein